MDRHYQAHPSRTAYRAPYRGRSRAWKLAALAVDFLVLLGIFLLVPLVLYIIGGY
jgi:hypothetical protein